MQKKSSSKNNYLVTNRQKKPLAHKADISDRQLPVKHIVAIASGKGGVGKSTLTQHIAVALSKQQYKVGVIDADIYGPSQAVMFGAEAQKINNRDDRIKPLTTADGIQFVSVTAFIDKDAPMIWRAPMVTKLIQEFLYRIDWPTLDYLLIDLPPGTGDIQITLTQQVKLAGALIITTPQQVAYKIAEKAVQMFQRVNVPVLGVIENMTHYVCSHCGHERAIFHGDAVDYLQKKYQLQCLGKIPLDEKLVNAADHGKTIFIDAPNSPTAQAFEQIVDNLNKTLAEKAVNSNRPKHIGVDDGNLRLTWPDGKVSRLSPYQLRLQCTCALCVDEISGKPLLNKVAIADTITMTRLEPVGLYGLKIYFSDGHHTGIYTFAKLKQMETAL